MRWLWLVSVGVTDVQCPVWTKDDYGLWQGPQRFQLGRGGVRKTHEGLLTLLRRERIRFDPELPPPVERELADRLRFEFEHDPAGDEFLAALHPADYRLSPQADTIPNDQEERLPLYCPKVAPLADKARDIIGRDTVSVLVLNTRRAEDFGSKARDEPIASGPLVASYLAERLGLTWIDSDGRLPETFASGCATWIDILIDHEAMEDPEAQECVVERLNAALSHWSGASGSDDRRVLVTTSGGMPPLKPFIERMSAIHVGQQYVTLLDNPEQGDRNTKATTQALNYGERVAERETLRFHCVEALRLGDYAGAYGLARRAAHLPWASAVRDRLGPLLEWPGRSMYHNGCPLESFALTAAQVEMRLRIGDVAGALLRLGSFLEAATWTLIGRDARIRELGLTVDRENECLEGFIPPDHELFSSRLPYFSPNPYHVDESKHRVTWLTQNWPKWLALPEGGQSAAGHALIKLCAAYNSEQKKPHPSARKPRDFRNLLAHGSDPPVDLNEVQRCLERELIAGVGLRFGQNFLDVKPISSLLEQLGVGNLSETLRAYLADIRQRIIEG